MRSGEKEVVGVRRGKPKKKRGRESKKKSNPLDGGDFCSNSQIMACNAHILRSSCQEDARDSVTIGQALGLIRKEDGAKVWKIFQEWETRDREVAARKNVAGGIGHVTSG